jgi:hypothetical protein
MTVAEAAYTYNHVKKVSKNQPQGIIMEINNLIRNTVREQELDNPIQE